MCCVAMCAGLFIGTLTMGCTGDLQPKAPTAAADSPADESRLVGDWRGTSLVVARNSAAKDETVVWHIRKADAPGKLLVDADKFVNGRAIPMGRLEFTFDPATQTIQCEIKPGVWKLKVAGNRLEGTLTGHDKTVFRKVSLTKAR